LHIGLRTVLARYLPLPFSSSREEDKEEEEDKEKGGEEGEEKVEEDA